MATPRDREILNSVVNPLLPLGEGVFDEQNEIPKTLQDEEQDTPEICESRSLERQAIVACDEGRLDKALTLLGQAIQMAPNRPACYNNRAQVLRLKGLNAEARRDLDKAIEVSGGRGRSACQAYVQRGLLNKLEERPTAAAEDFKASAALGSEFAKSLLVQMNPYAAMCNKMLKNVFTALENGSDAVANPFKEVETNKHQG